MSENKSKQNGSSQQKGQPIKEIELSGSDARAKLAELLSGTTLGSSSGNSDEPKEHKFWNTQPVPHLDSKEELNRLGDEGKPYEMKTVADVPKEPYAMLEPFKWSQIDVKSDTQLEEVYRLLNENYVEDTEAMFRFDYSRDFLRWALMPPGWQSCWHIGVRVKGNEKLVAFISAIPATIQIHKNTVNMVEINFLCVHKKLRSKRLAPVLIREITRRVNLRGIWQAAYTAGAVLPRPVSSSRYFHRSLNPKKLIEVGFSRLQPRMTMARTLKLYSVGMETSIPGIRPMCENDIPSACIVYKKFMASFDMHAEMNDDEFRHWFLPREGVVYSYVVENLETHELTDMVSFYSLPSSIIRHPLHSVLYAAYAFCIAAMATPITELVRDVLVLARRNGFDVFNALSLARHEEFFKELKFHVGDGELNYYLYNWKCRPISSEKNALILL